ncbi:4Fe-4S dicluster domain-containing protein [Eubacterium multiforme]|uniref:Anaerobic sulfite reductase subunit A n=1 Tax=Eubacterium multiforme TaxID=83339 RepID=A0ABT9UNP2_9FIRM|nr:4Fe-4S dicluster domain-containing protein [Eubacterium multiforme]MDQ0148253.1 anaerobic sulfite reductase subunit A [Eubacterium multiforme]
MDYKLSTIQGDELIKRLQKEYRIYAPTNFEGEGRHSYTNNIRYGEINSFSEVIYKEKSQYSPKELLIPINHTLSLKYGNKEIDAVNDEDERGMIILLRSCDLHGIKRIDNSLKNDKFYRNRRDKAKFMIMECPKSFDTCFCVSMGTNESENYSLGIRFNEDGVSIKVKDDSFNKYFKDLEETNFDIRFAKENEIKVRIPNIDTWDKIVLDRVKNLDLWNTYKDRCIGCGSCNMSCITCSCMLKQEVTHTDNSNLKEVRRTWNGCQLIKSSALEKKSLSEIVPIRIRQRVLDKFYRPKLDVSREQICVGCGRCTDICPRYINFAVTVNKLSDELDKIYEDLGRTIK